MARGFLIRDYQRNMWGIFQIDYVFFLHSFFHKKMWIIFTEITGFQYFLI